ncbi:MAG TPA: glycine--tRNA ligase subunit beta [Spongiibacteraceae bacterium]|nr:glycine--tRNA ligase subunit beta [Spongiibacteraceae bacterium]HCS26157.1 glycine--tRNA ligase subunit beta [Spongiibacteraceae bacterium]
MKRDLLIEVGTEELPPVALKGLRDAFADSLESQLREAGLGFESIERFASPRRLALVLRQLSTQAPSQTLEAWGPPAKVAFDSEGKPTRAAEAFAGKNGIAVAELKQHIANDGKQDKLFFKSEQEGAKTADVIFTMIDKALAALPIPKRMRWGASRAEFVRPVHWLAVVYGDETLNGSALHLPAGNTTRGHRFHANTELTIKNAADYESLLLNEGKVIASFEKRRDMIREQVTAEGKKLGGEAVISDDLLDEVTALVEWPVALAGSFEQRFLAVPAEALISSMKEHQKYFHVVDANGALLPHFITVANIESRDPAQVIAGNEKVIRPRLSDAAFFFETDCKTSLFDRREKLKSIVFQEKLGTVFDKTGRIAALAKTLAPKMGADAALAERAALLCKSDLVTDMVFEFADMQGIAGYYYANNDGEPAEVASAMQEQYLPRFAGDALPATATGSVVALADRLDTITGIFGIGQPPSGSKDPFALRRACLGVLRIILEQNLELDLRELIELASAQHKGITANSELTDTVLAYMIERLRAVYDDQNIPAEVFMAVTAKNLSAPLDIDRRVKAVYSFYQLPEAQALAAANKRVSNILAKGGATPGDTIDSTLLQEAAEKALASALETATSAVSPLLASGDYEKGLSSLASLREPVDAFFDQVMVNADDEKLRANRLALLSNLRALFLQVADISQLVPGKN